MFHHHTTFLQLQCTIYHGPCISWCRSNPPPWAIHPLNHKQLLSPQTIQCSFVAIATTWYLAWHEWKKEPSSAWKGILTSISQNNLPRAIHPSYQTSCFWWYSCQSLSCCFHESKEFLRRLAEEVSLKVSSSPPKGTHTGHSQRCHHWVVIVEYTCSDVLPSLVSEWVSVDGVRWQEKRRVSVGDLQYYRCTMVNWWKACWH